MKELAKQKQPFERVVLTRAQALEMFSSNRFKVDLIKSLPDSEV